MSQLKTLLWFFGLWALQVYAKPIQPIQPIKAPERIVVLSPHLLDWVQVFERLPQVIATLNASYFAYDLPKNIVFLGQPGTVSARAILKLKPDLILAWSGGNSPALLQALTNKQAPLVAIKATQLSELPAEVLRIGLALGQPQKAKLWSNRIQAQLDSGRAQFRRRHLKPRVFYEMWSAPLASIAHTSYIQQALSWCQLDNVFADVELDYFQISQAQVVRRNPEWILQPQSATLPHRLFDWTRWPHLQAVQKLHVLQVPADAMHRPGAKFVTAWFKVCTQIHQATAKHL
jgi:vitamin B12 transport system substrate-binding protein